MARLKLTLEYDGTEFRGWARQPTGRTVEGVVREALDTVVPQWGALAVAGRTDTGVHATGQVVSLDAVGGPPVERFPEAVNAVLPDDVAVIAAETAAESFHARFSATGRTYRYVVLATRTRAPLRARGPSGGPGRSSEARLAACAAALVGEHDFTRLHADRDTARGLSP